MGNLVIFRGVWIRETTRGRRRLWSARLDGYRANLGQQVWIRNPLPRLVSTKPICQFGSGCVFHACSGTQEYSFKTVVPFP